jgi:hypothetical protein
MKSSKRNGFPIGWTSISLMVVMTAGASAQTRQAETAAKAQPSNATKARPTLSEWGYEPTRAGTRTPSSIAKSMAPMETRSAT